MRFQIALRFVLPVLLSAGSNCAVAQDEIPLIQILTCNLQADTPYFSGAAKTLKGKTTDDGHGVMLIAGPVRLGDLCFDNVHIGAAFGAFVVSGSLCDGESAPLTDLVRRMQTGLIPKALPPQPGMVAVYVAPKYSLVVFRGESQVPPDPDPTSARLSYTCSYMGSGPQ